MVGERFVLWDPRPTAPPSWNEASDVGTECEPERAFTEPPIRLFGAGFRVGRYRDSGCPFCFATAPNQAQRGQAIAHNATPRYGLPAQAQIAEYGAGAGQRATLSSPNLCAFPWRADIRITGAGLTSFIRTSKARCHHELAAHGSVLHCLVGLDDLLETKRVADGNLDLAGFYILDEALKDRRREVDCVSAVCGQPNASWDVVDRVELLNRPLVGKYPGEASNAVNPDATKRVGKGRGADQLQGCLLYTSRCV